MSMFPENPVLEAALRPSVTLEAQDTPESLRQEFLLDPGIVYLNHGGFGAVPRPVFERYLGWLRQPELGPTEFVGRRRRELLASARQQAAQALNAPIDAITFVDNATAGLNVVIQSLDMRPGDEILGTSLEYGALDLAWTHFCDRAGASYVRAPVSVPFTTAQAIVEQVWASVTERTRAIYISHITSSTSAIMPVSELCQRARDAGIISIIDGAHVPGQLPLDLAALDADFYAGNFHKWVCSPRGSAFLYANPRHHDWLESLSVGWGWTEGHTFVSRNEDLGTRGYGEFLSVPRAIDFQADHHWASVRAACHNRLAAFRDRVHDRFGTMPMYPNGADWFSQMALVSVPGDDPVTLRAVLYNRYNIEVPVMKHADMVCVRVSVQGYTTDADLDALETALVDIAG